MNLKKRIVSAILSVTMVASAIPMTMFGSGAATANKYALTIAGSVTVHDAQTGGSSVSAGDIDGGTYYIDTNATTGVATVTVTGGSATSYTFTNHNKSSRQSFTLETISDDSTDKTCAVAFTAADLNVTYNGNSNTGGSIPTDTLNYTANESVTVLGNSGTLVKTGYTFDGWSTTVDDVSTKVGATFEISTDTTLYALWKADQLTASITVAPETGTGATPNWYTGFTATSTTVANNTPSTITINSTYYKGQELTRSANGAVVAAMNKVNGLATDDEDTTGVSDKKSRSLAFQFTVPAGATKVKSGNANYFYAETNGSWTNKITTATAVTAGTSNIVMYFKTIERVNKDKFIIGPGADAGKNTDADTKSYVIEFLNANNDLVATYKINLAMNYTGVKPTPPAPPSPTPTPSPAPTPAPVKPVDPKVNENGSVNSNKAAEVAASSKTGTVTIQNAKSVSSDTLKAIEKAAEKSGKDATLVASATVGNKVVAKLTIDCANADKFAKNIKLGVNTSNTAKAAVAKKMKSFANDIQTLRLEQRTTFGAPVKISFKLDTKKIDPKKVVAYVLDPKTNKLTKVKCTVTKSGTITVTTKMGGDIVISEGNLTKK